MSLLFVESPLIASASLIMIGCSVYINKSIYVTAMFITLFIFLLYFYRYEEFSGEKANNNQIISPCEGTVSAVSEKNKDYVYIAIFLSPINKHTQIYPVNGIVIKRQYDHTGQFEIVMDLDKSKYNEKKMHYISMEDKTIIKLTQIAGFLPRMITSAEDVPMKVTSGEYLGMMKFGSRVDMLIPKYNTRGQKLNIYISKGMKVSIGDLICEFN